MGQGERERDRESERATHCKGAQYTLPWDTHNYNGYTIWKDGATDVAAVLPLEGLAVSTGHPPHPATPIISPCQQHMGLRMPVQPLQPVEEVEEE